MKPIKSLFTKLLTNKPTKQERCYPPKNKSVDEQFFDLTPVDNADPDGLYSEALRFAMENSAIRNIAITGPYGSGKTSVIKTFEKKSNYRFLNVSLATFSDPNSETHTIQNNEPNDITVKVERSILQQMLYGTDANALPYSRFKRISNPQWTNWNATLFVGWIAACGFLYKSRNDIFAIKGIEEVSWLWLFTAAYVFLFLVRLISKSIKLSHSLSVKKLSLQNGEVELAGVPESSILNKHLDEIIYFFEENNYDLVVFEDLDRFGNPEIFIKLREINKIINDRPTQKRSAQPLKFIYAIKDDVFLNKDRAKFFDFITPIIPIINNSNSREKLNQSIKPLNSERDIDDRFLGEVSLYLDDFRLIKNISNEFLIYEKKVGASSLNKLLAIIIYKNIYPRDFENLHHGKGTLYEIVQKRTEIIQKISNNIDSRIETLKAKISAADAEFLSNGEELVKIFWGHICGTHSELIIEGIYAGQSILTFDQIMDWKNFSNIFNEAEVFIHGRNKNNSHSNRRITLSSSFSSIEKKISPDTTFAARHERIKNKNTSLRQKIISEIDSLKERKTEISRSPLHKLLELSEFDFDAITKPGNADDLRLLTYLVRNGHLDETYNNYISIFHEGRMSRNDWSFIQAIRDFRAPDARTVIDTPVEVVSEMREEDFGSSYALNVALIDYLLENKATNEVKLRAVIEFISKHLPETDDFFRAYWLIGKNSASLTGAISDYWPNYGAKATSNELATRHIAMVLAYVDPAYIAKKMNENGTIERYLSANSHLVFSENITFTKGYEALKLINLKINDLNDILNIETLLNFSHENNLYSISINNIDIILSKYSPAVQKTKNNIFDSKTANYTTIRIFGSEQLKAYIKDNIDTYLNNVALALDTNKNESKESILEIITNPDIDKSTALHFALQQTFVFENFDQIPPPMWNDLIFGGKIALEWTNLVHYYNHEDCDTDKLLEMLAKPETYNNLIKTKFPKDQKFKEETNALRWFLISNKEISLSAYKAICTSIDVYYNNFPEDIPVERAMILVELKIVGLNEKSFSRTANHVKLRSKIIELNFPTYASSTEKYTIDINVKAELLSSNLNFDYKISLIKNTTVEELKASEELTKRTGIILSAPTINKAEISATTISHCLTSISDKRIKKDLLYNFIDRISDSEIREALSVLPEPYCHFITPNKRPKLEKTEANLALAEKLKDRKIISSFQDENDMIRINAFRKDFISSLLGRN